MQVEFRLPDVGEGITESEILKWYAKPGDAVREDEVLCEIETDKAVVELPVPCTGTLRRIHFDAGSVVAVGSVIATFDSSQGEASAPAGHTPSVQTTIPATAEPVQSGQTTRAIPARPPSMETDQGSPRAAPSTRKYARQQGVELVAIAGSGPKGRVLRADVDAQLGSGVPSAARHPNRLEVPPTRIPTTELQVRTPLKGLRKAIAEKMVRSVTVIPHATSAFRCNAERFVALRKTLQERLGIRISYTAMVMKAMVPALKAYPYFNASLDDAAQEIVEHRVYNVGFAAHTPNGLLVPVIKRADQKPLAEISAEIDRLAGLARERKIDLADLHGGTITLSNVGSHGGRHDLTGRPIVNHPESAIIAMTRIQPQAVVVDGAVVAQLTLDMVTSYDHRIIDGVYAAQFMELLIAVIEEPGMLLAHG